MSFTLCSSGAIAQEAGAKASSTALASYAILADFSDKAEGYLCGRTRYDWVANYASVSANFKPLLADACACIAANKLIKYDMSGYTSGTEATRIVNMNYDTAEQAIKVLSDSKLKKTMGITND